MTHKLFAERLNKELDDIDFPQHEAERVEAFSTMFHLPKFKAEAILSGNMLPSEELLQAISDELEVNANWLTGKEDH